MSGPSADDGAEGVRVPGGPARHPVHMTVNGRRERLVVETRLTLADALRGELALVGTHLGCEQGDCGACTVLVDGQPTRACLMLAVQTDGRTVETVEGLDRDGDLHPLQQAFLQHQAFQCGFCTPGFLMLGLALQRREGEISDEEIEHTVASNLCRCTGYASIAGALRAACDPRTGPEGPR